MLGYTVAVDNQENRKPWNKSAKNGDTNSSLWTSNFDDSRNNKVEREVSKPWTKMEESGNKSSSSTLSLHISAFENAIDEISNGIFTESKVPRKAVVRSFFQTSMIRASFCHCI